jgi:hypothetical protein
MSDERVSYEDEFLMSQRPMSLIKKLGIATMFIAATLAAMESFFRFVSPKYFAGRWEDSILLMGLFVIGSILLLAGVVVFHFIWRDHQP